MYSTVLASGFACSKSLNVDTGAPEIHDLRQCARVKPIKIKNDYTADRGYVSNWDKKVFYASQHNRDTSQNIAKSAARC